MTEQPQGMSIQQTATIGMSAGGGIACAIWLCSPTWPPPDAVLSLLVGYSLPVIHLIGRGIYRRVARWSGEPVPDHLTAAPAVAAAPLPPAAAP